MEVRLWTKVAIGAPDECWPWRGSVTADGYAVIGVGGKHPPVHRVAYELWGGVIPAGHVVDHQCHNLDLTCPGGATCQHRRCCNPLHLEAVLPEVNSSRGRAGQYLAARTHCPAGHSYEEHGRRYPGRQGRDCGECKRLRSLEWYYRSGGGRDHRGLQSEVA